MIMCYNVFNVWPKTTLLPVWPRDTRRLDTPREAAKSGREIAERISFHFWLMLVFGGVDI